MNKPHWQRVHAWRLSDVRFELWAIWQLKKMLRIYADEDFGDKLRESIKLSKKILAKEVKKYEVIYGDKPNVKRMREEVEK